MAMANPVSTSLGKVVTSICAPTTCTDNMRAFLHAQIPSSETHPLDGLKGINQGVSIECDIDQWKPFGIGPTAVLSQCHVMSRRGAFGVLRDSNISIVAASLSRIGVFLLIVASCMDK